MIVVAMVCPLYADVILQEDFSTGTVGNDVAGWNGWTGDAGIEISATVIDAGNSATLANGSWLGINKAFNYTPSAGEKYELSGTPEAIMISCTEFIPAYSELFKYLDSRGNHEEVERFWEYLSDHFLGNLKNLAAQKGLRGCWEYWFHTLNEEAADFEMTLNEEEGYFRIDMHHCPSKGRLLEIKHIEPYHDYCSHCDLLYRRVLEPLGFRYELDTSRCDRAACSIVVKKN